MCIRQYEGYLRNRVQLCRALCLAQGADRRETERAVIGAGFQRWGHALPDHLYGSFAFAIWDTEREELFCARDPFGIQTFYYCDAEDGVFLCGPDLQEITKSPHYRIELDREALQLYLLFGYPVGERTLYKGIRKLMPGCSLTWDGRTVQIDRYYAPSFHPDEGPSAEEWAQKIDQTLQTILNDDRACFDFTQCGSFLSGGVDSSYLLAASGVRDAIGIGFQEAGFSELPAASAAADALGVRFHETCVRAEEFFSILPRFLQNLELPLADPCAPVFALGCEKTAGRIGVCLSGEGADEFFAGYNVYQRSDELGARDALYCGCSGVMEQEAGLRLLGTDKAFPLESLTQEIRGRTGDAEPLSRMLAVDTALWLEGDILFGVGRSARANGLQLLLPFADRRMFELAAGIPSALKRRGETAKYILRKAAETRIPHEIAFRRKVGFSVPARRWFREERFRPQIEQALFGPISRAYFDQNLLRSCWRSFLDDRDGVWSIPYTVYIFVLWHKYCFDFNRQRKETAEKRPSP